MRIALTIAGSDSSGGAGIQADLKTFAAFGVYGASAITAVTAQNTKGVSAWEPISTELVIAQIETVASDIPPDAVKTGMLASAAIVEAVAATIEELELPNLVVDPVMVAKGGSRLLRDDAIAALVAELLPRAEVATPNIPEAEVLVGFPIRTLDEMREAARRIRKLGPRVVVLKGGHLPPSESDPDSCVDVVSSAQADFDVRGARIETRRTHGTGCTFAAAITAALALGQPVEQAIRGAREYVEGAIRSAPQIGSGHGPLNHFWRVY
ncbi:MAG TPA: bifunctional hydroxymethylpyrimidine kinase/phosphomethylpyrimidine kinase [Vicinamibacterales bacterium]|jgi:hydroxymethylpyrimidine/phosphomethylpyrimidine kinase|nr:bifunctional hydroxymethylpyrimidine kinase/phosphomethylpyrimidine kinase [Vicinamibacterales bacterium]